MTGFDITLLPKKEAKAVILIWVFGLTYSEAGEVMGCSRQWVQKLETAGIERLRIQYRRSVREDAEILAGASRQIFRRRKGSGGVRRQRSRD